MEETVTKDMVLEAIEKMEEEDFSEFLQGISDQLEEFIGGDEEAVICPESKISARDWVFAFVKLKEQIEFLKKEYIPALTARYIAPVRESIEKCEQSQEFIKAGLQEFLEKAEEKKVVFPDLATVSEAKTPSKLVYPEDESSFLEKLVSEKSEFVIYKPSIDKNSMLKIFRDTDEIPHGDLIGEGAGKTIRVTVSKSRK